MILHKNPTLRQDKHCKYMQLVLGKCLLCCTYVAIVIIIIIIIIIIVTNIISIIITIIITINIIIVIIIIIIISIIIIVSIIIIIIIVIIITIIGGKKDSITASLGSAFHSYHEDPKLWFVSAPRSTKFQHKCCLFEGKDLALSATTSRSTY